MQPKLTEPKSQHKTYTTQHLTKWPLFNTSGTCSQDKTHRMCCPTTTSVLVNTNTHARVVWPVTFVQHQHNPDRGFQNTNQCHMPTCLVVAASTSPTICAHDTNTTSVECGSGNTQQCHMKMYVFVAASNSPTCVPMTPHIVCVVKPTLPLPQRMCLKLKVTYHNNSGSVYQQQVICVLRKRVGLSCYCCLV